MQCVLELEVEAPTFSEGLSTADMVHYTGLAIHTLGYWDRVQLLTPSIAQATGKGSGRRYSVEDLVKAFLIRDLKSQGWPLSAIRGAAQALTFLQKEPNTFVAPVIIHHGNSPLILYHTQQGKPVLLDVLHGMQVVFAIALDELQAQAWRCLSVK